MLKVSPGKFTVIYDGIRLRLETPVVIHGLRENVLTTALWDTGASMSCVDSSIVERAALRENGYVTASTPNGNVVLWTFYADITFPGGKAIDLPVSSNNMGSMDAKVLIGMDVMSKGEFSLSSIDGRTVFSFRFPPEEGVDFVSEQEALSVSSSDVTSVDAFPKVELDGCVITFEK